jgi:hypothetical protein
VVCCFWSDAILRHLTRLGGGPALATRGILPPEGHLSGSEVSRLRACDQAIRFRVECDGVPLSQLPNQNFKLEWDGLVELFALGDQGDGPSFCTAAFGPRHGRDGRTVEVAV